MFLLADSKKRLAKLNRLTVVSENFGTFYGGVGDDSVGNNNGIFVQD